MAGEGLGRHPNPEKIFNYSDPGPEVVSVGDFILDKTVPLGDVPEETRDRWKKEDWFPDQGESRPVDSVPDEVDKFVDNEFPGGKAANQALAATLAGSETAYLGRTSHDPEDLEYMNEKGVNLESVVYENKIENEAYVFIDEEGDNRIAAEIDPSTGLDYLDDVEDVVMDADYVLLSNGMPTETLEELAAVLEGEGRPEVILDPSPVDSVHEVLDSDGIDYVTPNGHEYEQLSEALQGDYTLVRTSAEGVELDKEVFVEAPDVENIVDTTAAGDTFNGYLAAGLAGGANVEEAAERACRAASTTVQYQGAQPSIPEIPL
ncbi:MAG: PfkB family carbohydrate kinase [Candidatus Nanohalobium sp.]